MAYNLALAWFEGKYDQAQAELSAELQGIDFDMVMIHYGNIYGECEQITGVYN